MSYWFTECPCRACALNAVPAGRADGSSGSEASFPASPVGAALSASIPAIPPADQPTGRGGALKKLARFVCVVDESAGMADRKPW